MSSTGLTTIVSGSRVKERVGKADNRLPDSSFFLGENELSLFSNGWNRNKK